VDIEEGPELPGGPWYRGRKLAIEVPTPLEYTLDMDPDEPGNLGALYDAEAFPVMRADLLEALEAVGVTNLELFPALLIDPEAGERHADYVAFNVLGLVAAADLAASALMPGMPGGPLATGFDSLVIDEDRARGLRLFRLAESCSAIVVDEVVRAEVERRQIPGVVFYEQGEWSG